MKRKRHTEEQITSILKEHESGASMPDLPRRHVVAEHTIYNVKLHFTQPGKPTQNAFAESFNGKYRDYCLDLHWFASLGDASSTIDEWREHYNHVRPHRSLGKKPPLVFAEEAA